MENVNPCVLCINLWIIMVNGSACIFPHSCSESSKTTVPANVKQLNRGPTARASHMCRGNVVNWTVPVCVCAVMRLEQGSLAPGYGCGVKTQTTDAML